MTKINEENVENEIVENREETLVQNIKPLIFISHDSRDAELAKAFGELLKKSSMGILRYFCSSDKSGKSGIEYGAEWYTTIKQKVGNASDVVCLLTDRSISRPWLLYEAGMAIGRKGSKVLGLVMGMDMKVATEGPFAQFQNCSGEKKDIVQLVKQLASRVPDAEPDDEIICDQVDKFLKIADGIQEKFKKTKKKDISSSDDKVTSSSAKLFEEVKYMFNELSSRIQQNVMYKENGSRENLYRFMMDRFRFLEEESPRFAIRLGLSLYREFAPWIYEEGNYLLNQLLSKEYDHSEDIMRPFIRLMRSIRGPELFSSEIYKYIDLERVNDRILMNVERLLSESRTTISFSKKSIPRMRKNGIAESQNALL